MNEKRLLQAADRAWLLSRQRSLTPGFLASPFDVPDRPGYKYVNKGVNGDEGLVYAEDKIGVADTVQRVEMLWENQHWVLHEATEYAGGAGGSTTLNGLTDVTIAAVGNGDILRYDSGTSQWVNVEYDASGTVYTGGDGVDISVSNVISTDLEGGGGLIIGGFGGLAINTGDGIIVSSNEVQVALALGSGLTTTAGLLHVVNYHGIARDGNGIYIDVKTTSGLVLDSAGLAVGEGDGIDVLTSTIAVNVTEIIDTNYGLTSSSNDIRIDLASDSGLTFSSGNLTLGTPSTLAHDSTNIISTTTHNHAVAASSDVGTVPITSLLKSNASGQLTLAQLTLRGNLVFAGGDRSITASDNLTISPSTDLILDPTGLIVLPTGQEMRTGTFTDLPTGIFGFSMFDRGSNYRQLTTGAIKADELYVRVFVADEVRIDRGEEYWSKSYGVVEEDFVLPADEATVDVWFENAPGLDALDPNLFSVGDWLLARTINWDTALLVEKIWFTVDSPLVAGSVDGYRQQWRLKRESGGTTGTVVKKGNTFLDAGQVGQGWIHLSALEQDNGPFIQMGEFTSVVDGDLPLHTNYVRLGNLKGTVDYSDNAWGLAAGTDLLGSDGIASTPSTGFSGFTVDGDDGMRLFNTPLELYDGSTLKTVLNNDYGLSFAFDNGPGANWGRYVRWQSTLSTVDSAGYAYIGGYELSGNRYLDLKVRSTSVNTFLNLTSYNAGTGNQSIVSLESDKIIMIGGGTFIRMSNGGVLINDNVSTGAVSPLHVSESTSNTGGTAGVTIEQEGSGDAVLHFVQAGYYWTIGIDNSDNDFFKLSNSTTLGTSDILVVGTSGAILNGTSAAFSINASSGNPALFFNEAGSQQWGMYYNTTSNYFSISETGVADHFIIEDGGQVGIHTASPIDDLTITEIGSNATSLRVKNSQASQHAVVYTESNGGYIQQAIWGTSAGATRFGQALADAGEFLAVNVSRLLIGTYNSANIIFGTNNTANMIIDTNGHVGIGTVTPGVDIAGTWDWSPTKLLHVDATGEVGLILRGTNAATLDLIDAGTTADSRRFRIHKDGIHALLCHWNDAGLDPSSGYIYVGGEGYGVGLANVPATDASLIVGSGGSVKGIVVENYGTAQAHFMGRRATGSIGAPTSVTSGSVVLNIMAVGYTSGGWSTNQNAEIDVRATEDYNTGTTGKGGAEIVFFTRANGAAGVTERMTIGQDGSLEVPYIWATAVAGTAVHINSNGILTKTTSSQRYKSDIRDLPVEYGDGFVMSMRPIVYKATNGDNRADQIGFIAEEIQAIGGGLGEPFISRNDAGQVESLHYDRLIAPTAAAVQRLIARNAQLEARIEQLERRLN